MPRKAAPAKTLDELLAGIEPLDALRITCTVLIDPIGRPGLRLATKSITNYKRPAKPLGKPIVAQVGETHADLLRRVAEAMDRVAQAKAKRKPEGL